MGKKIVVSKSSEKPPKKKGKGRPAPARTIESREKQLVNLATTLAEKQLIAGTASSQVITHYLKLGTTQAALEQEKLKNENLLIAAKTEALRSSKHIEELFTDAIKAMKAYSGVGGSPEEEEDGD